MKASIIIPAYNEQKVIGACIRSLHSQDYPDMEIIVVNDGSRDATAAIVSSLKVRVISQAHGGPAVAKNQGAAYAKGEILVFLDADMTFEPDFISKLVSPILNGTAVGTFCREVYISNPDNKWSRCWAYNRRTPLCENIFPETIPDEWNIFRAVLKTEFDQAGGFDDIGYGEDITLGDKIGKPAHSAPGAVFYHHNPSSFREVFENAAWIGKGERVKEYGRRFWLRFSPPFTFYRATKMILEKKCYFFLHFALIYDFGVLMGVLSSLVTKRHFK